MKKAISPLVGVVLLVVITVGLSFTITSYLSQTTKTLTKETTEIKVGNRSVKLEKCALQSVSIVDYSDKGGVLRVAIRNNGAITTYIRRIVAYDDSGVMWVIYENESGDILEVNEEKVYFSQQEKPDGFGELSRIRATTFCPGVFDVLNLKEQGSAYKNWLAGFHLRRKVVVDNSAGGDELYDYQVGFNVSYDGDMQKDFSDLRFTWINPETGAQEKVPYWIEEKVDGSWAYVWIKLPHIPAGGKTTIYMYYGNTTPVSGESNGDDVFLFFDDFEGTALDENKWVIIDTIPTVSGGELYLPGGNSIEGVRSVTSFSGSFVVEYWLRAESSSGDWDYGIAIGTLASDLLYFIDDTPSSWQNYLTIMSPGWWNNVDSISTQATDRTSYHHYVIIMNETTGAVFADYTDGRNNDDDSDRVYSGYIWLVNDNDGSGNEGYYDKILVRKYTSPEPAVSIGEEEAYSG